MVTIAEHDTLSKYLRARYEDARDTADRFTLTDVANSIGISQAYVTTLHNGAADKAIAKWAGKRALNFLRAHNLTTEEIRQAADKWELDNVHQYLDYERAGLPVRVREGGPQVRYMGAVGAGRFSGAFEDDEGEYVPITPDILRHHDPSDIFAVTVSGDSMIADEARGHIPNGARAYFHARLRPSPGQIVCVRLDHADTNVIKVFRPGEQFVTLESMNRKHRPIVLDAEDTAAHLQGVLIGVSIPF